MEYVSNTPSNRRSPIMGRHTATGSASQRDHTRTAEARRRTVERKAARHAKRMSIDEQLTAWKIGGAL
jgi:hypothetical protein